MTQEEFYWNSYEYFSSQFRALMDELDEKSAHSELSYQDAFAYLNHMFVILRSTHTLMEEQFNTYSSLSENNLEKQIAEENLIHLFEILSQ